MTCGTINDVVFCHDVRYLLVLTVDHEGTVEVLQQDISVIILFNPWCTGNGFVWDRTRNKWDREKKEGDKDELFCFYGTDLTQLFYLQQMLPTGQQLLSAELHNSCV